MLRIILALLSICGAINGQETQGLDAELGMYPWIVSITAHHEEDFRKCGGALISDEWILTTGLCGTDTPLSFTVQIGQVDFALADLISVSAENLYAHPEHEYYNNNIALLRLPSPVVFSDTVGIISLPTNADEDFAGTNGLYAGIVSESVNLHESVVRYEFLSVIADEDCDDIFERETGEFCAFGNDDNPGQAPCYMADGSTLATNNGDEEYTLIGLSSWAGCNNTNPAIFTRTSLYLDWISDVTNLS